MSQDHLARQVNPRRAPNEPAERRTAVSRLLLVLPLLLAPASWAQRPASLGLDGPWEFRFAPDDRGLTEQWFAGAAPFERQLQVPGCWDAQGVGAPTAKMRHNAIGVGWYRREVTLPADWSGQRVWLRVGGVHRSARVWCNGQSVGEHWGYPTAFRCDLTTALRPGASQQLVLAVDSRHHRERDPLVGAFDIIDFMDLTWGGFHESLSLEATGQTWLDDVFVKPHPGARRATVEVALAGATTEPLELACTVRPATGGAPLAAQQVVVPAGRTSLSLTVALPGAPLWTPETPNLLTAELVLTVGGRPLDRLDQRFGLRRLEATAQGFRLNGERFFLRGYGDDYTFPRELVAPASVEFWRGYLRRRKEFGFNGVRHHSTMLGESYLRAADEVGVFVQPELPIAYEPFFRAATPAGRDLYRQVWRDYLRQMRNHPSVFAWCGGNEQWHGFDLGPELYDLATALDPTRPTIDTDGISPGGRRRSLDYHAVQFNEGTVPWGHSRGKYAVRGNPRPLIVHEMSNLSVLPDPADIPLYDGVIKPFWLEQMRAAVARRGLQDRLPVLLDASRRLQASLLKLNIEAARLNPEVDGHYQWLFRDYWTQSTGFVNQFDQPRALTPAMARQFIAPAVLLWDRDRAAWRGGERIPVRLYLSDYRPAAAPPLGPVQARLGDQAIALAPPPDGARRGVIGPWTGTVEAPSRTAAARLALSVAAGEVRNQWPVWVYPATTATTSPVAVRPRLTAALVAKLAAGGTVVVSGDARPFPALTASYKTAWWKGGEQEDHCYGNLFGDHPALRGFPTDGYGDLQCHALLNRRPVVLLDEVPGRLEPIVWCLDVPWQMRRKAYLFEARVGAGRLLFGTFDLSAAARAADPATAWLHDGLVRYAASDAFRPAGELPLDWLQQRLGQDALPAPSTYVEGYGKLLDCTDGATRWLTHREDEVTVYTVRQTDGRQKLSWRTGPIPADWRQATITFVWAGGLGWRSQPGGGHFRLALGGQPLLDFTHSTASAVWRSADGQVTLHYEVRRHTDEDSFGVFYLTLPAARVKPGQAVDLTVTATAQDSRRWLSLAPYADVAAAERADAEP